jgi:hypothetical protein
MKLQELAAINPTRQSARVMESYFGQKVNFDALSQRQAEAMLARVRGLMQEHRASTDFHTSERNPAYLKLVMMEEGLIGRILSDDSREVIRESEVQQAQVVLAAQDMVDKIQDMLEEASEMQFKDLPALCDQIKNEVGMEQSQQFNADATAALSGLIQNLQGARQQLSAALNVVTGQAPALSGMATPAAPADMAPAPVAAPAEMPPAEEEPELQPAAAALGRAKR